MVEPSVTARSSATDRPRPRVVGVITSRADLDFAMRVRRPPDLFELRLDHLVHVLDELENKLSRLRAPLLNPLLKLAQRRKIRRIISFHNLESTPDSRSLRVKARAAKAHGADIFKVATRTDTPMQLARLLDFITKKDADLPVSAMGIGKLGAISRVLLSRAGSVLAYASLRDSDIEGQMSLEQLRAFGIGTMTKPERRMTKE